VNSWLRQMDAVLAFCSARPNDGGTGAVYVLLKKAQQWLFMCRPAFSNRLNRRQLQGITEKTDRRR
jgi:hypothetical protein